MGKGENEVPFWGDPEVNRLVSDDGWPCQRLRVGYGLVLFFGFEVTVGGRLPPLFAAALLGLGLVLLASAAGAIRKWKLESSAAVLRAAFAESRSRPEGRGALSVSEAAE